MLMLISMSISAAAGDLALLINYYRLSLLNCAAVTCREYIAQPIRLPALPSADVYFIILVGLQLAYLLLFAAITATR